MRLKWTKPGTSGSHLIRIWIIWIPEQFKVLYSCRNYLNLYNAILHAWKEINLVLFGLSGTRLYRLPWRVALILGTGDSLTEQNTTREWQRQHVENKGKVTCVAHVFTLKHCIHMYSQMEYFTVKLDTEKNSVISSWISVSWWRSDIAIAVKKGTRLHSQILDTEENSVVCWGIPVPFMFRERELTLHCSSEEK